jgi:large subunit ribosomal protein L14e|tara:strand:+ start:310 stop:621 length:312 start_codon:yes stop_codon:yes gene_type:complete
MFEIGRICIKIAGRDAGQTAIVVDKIDNQNVLIDGNVRRRKCNISHLEPLNEVIKIKKGASTEEVHKAMITSKIKVIEKKKIKKTKKKKTEEKKSIKTKKNEK